MSLVNEPLVSVVTPVYNGEDFIAECIESILSQTYSNWEYIILNNCSADNTLEIAKDYARKDNRIKVYDNDRFLNQIPNWNAALRKISPESKYCKVVQADDWIFPECLEKMVELAEEYPSVGVVSAYRLVETNIIGDGLPYKVKFLSGRETCRKVLQTRIDLFGSATTVLFRSDLIRSKKSFFDESVIHADTYSCFDVLRESDFGFVHQVLTFTRRHNESTTTFCNYYNTYVVSSLKILLDFHQYYLNEEEFKKLLSKSLFNHHRALINLILKGRNIWGYHKKELDKLGLQINWGKFIKALLYELLDFKGLVKMLAKKLQINSEGRESEHQVKEIIEDKKVSTTLSSK